MSSRSARCSFASPFPSPARFETARTLDVQIGGAEANVAAACARLGLRTAWISGLTGQPWGERVRRDLTGHGGRLHICADTAWNTPGPLFPRIRRRAASGTGLYDRRDSAFSCLTPDLVDWEQFDVRGSCTSADHTGTGRATSHARRTDFDEAAMVSFDINYRSTLCRQLKPARSRVRTARARYVFLGRTEAQIVFGSRAEQKTF